MVAVQVSPRTKLYYNMGNAFFKAGNLGKAIAVLLLLFVCFILWTDNPPDLGIFWG